MIWEREGKLDFESLETGEILLVKLTNKIPGMEAPLALHNWKNTAALEENPQFLVYKVTEDNEGKWRQRLLEVFGWPLVAH